MKKKLLVVCDFRSPWVRKFLLTLSGVYDLHVFDVKTYRKSYLFDVEASVSQFRVLNPTIKVFEVPSYSFLQKLTSIFRINYYICKNKIISSMSIYNGYYGLLHLFLLTRKKIGYWVGSDINSNSSIKKFVNKVLLSNFLVNLFNGDSLLSRANLLSNSQNKFLFFMGLDTSEFLGRSVDKERIILCTRGFEPVYNNKFIIDSLARLDLVSMNYDVVFTSGGSQLAELVNYADRQLTSENRAKVHFLGGCKRDEIVDYYLRAEFYISASVSDGASVSLWEAFVARCYPLLSNIDANRYWADILRCDLFDFSEDSFVNCVSDALSDNKKEAIDFNQRYAISELDFSDVSRKFIQILTTGGGL